jgi:hypothetical protein
MKKTLYLYATLLWSLVQAFLFGCLIAVINKYFINNPAPKDQGDIVALVMMIVFVIVGVWIDAAIRNYNPLYMMLLDAIVSPIRFALQIVTIVKYHQNGNPKNFAQRGGYYTCNLRDWVMYVLFSAVSLSPNRQYKAPAKYTGPIVPFEYEERYKTKKSAKKSVGDAYQPPKSPDVYSDEYQSKYWTCKHCRYYTTYKKKVDGFLIQYVVQGWCTRNGYETEEYRKCMDFVKK